MFIGDHQLYVSNYLSDTQFPLHEINDITVTPFLSISSKKITITLKNSKAYPKYIEFIPIKGITEQIINQIETDIKKGDFS
jgi:hypothetical protein